ncbi:hypothetical protein LPJ75_005167, partial [Coemansia sp. RSA 2598]
APSIQGTADNDDDCDPENEAASNACAGDERAASEGLQHGRGKAPLVRESLTRLRKKPSARKAHVKRAVSTAALRTRVRYGAAHRRDNYPAKTHLYAGAGAAGNNGSDIEGSYVDLSGDSDSEGGYASRQNEQRHQQREPQINNTARVAHAAISALDQPRASPHSSTATLGGAAHDADDTATTASMDSPRQAQTDAMAQRAAAPSNANTNSNASANANANVNANVRAVEQGLEQAAGDTQAQGSGSRNTHPRDLSQPQASPQMRQQQQQQQQNSEHTRSADAPHDGADAQMHGESPNADRYQSSRQFDLDDQYTDTRGQLNGGRATYMQQQQPGSRQGAGNRRLSEEHPMAVAGYGAPAHMSMSTNRNMESLRQQSIIEREEEELELASSQLTGVPRRSNRPSSMVPHIFLNPSTPAYAQQLRKTERVYTHARSMAHPLLESISRCVALREQRLAMGVPRVQPRSWVSRRTLAEPSEVDLQAEWWESLMPPPHSQTASTKDQRTSSGRAQLAELPHWVLAPDEAKCAVYGPDLATPSLGAGFHESVDPSCEHVRELRIRAKELRLI